MILYNKSLFKRAQRTMLAAFGLAFVHQLFFYGHEFGIAYPVFVLLLYVYMFRGTRMQPGEVRVSGWLVGGAAVLLAATYALFDNPVFGAINALAVPGLTVAHMAYLFSPRKPGWSAGRLLAAAGDHLLPQSFRHWATQFRIMRMTAVSRMGSRRRRTAGKILAGLLVAIPLLAVIVPLLASADGVFDSALNRLPRLWERLSLGEGLARTAWIALFFVLFFTYLWGFVDTRSSAGAELHGPQTPPARRPGIDPIILATILIAVNVVYLLFVAVQFVYLFGAAEGALPDDTTYAEYARSGFAELVAITLLNFALLVIALAFGEEGRTGAGRLRNALLLVLVACSAVMLASAYMRLVLYEEAYGYTYTRFLVHAFMIYLGLLIAAAGVRVLTPRLQLVKFGLAASLAAYLAVNYAGMDAFIAKRNIERYMETGKIDTPYLASLSADAVPVLVRFGQSHYPRMLEMLRDNGRAYGEDGSWQSYNLAERRAARIHRQNFAVPQ